MAIDINNKDFFNRTRKLRAQIEEKAHEAVNNVADEIMRLSQFEVPHDTGRLQNSGHVEQRGQLAAIIGYNTVYAARLHENPQFHFQKGRKGKYLEDPIKNNFRVLRQFILDSVKL